MCWQRAIDGELGHGRLDTISTISGFTLEGTHKITLGSVYIPHLRLNYVSEGLFIVL